MAMKAVRIEVIAAHSSGERQADVHAALGLMPTELVRGYRDAESIARDFGVSKAAAEVRLSQIEERSAKPTLPEVAAFLAGNGPRNETAGNDRKRRAEASVQRVWEKAAEAPGYDPSRYRLCSKGYLIAREQHLKHRSIHGWCERDGLIKSYRDINRLGIGETAFHDFADAPCAHCGNFTLSREGGALRCATCSRTAS
ncbi:MAG: hypothetical protein ACK4TL_12210 [Hyphomicrobiaceae bacterium]